MKACIISHNLLNVTYRIQTGQVWCSSEQKEKLLKCKSQWCLLKNKRVTNHWIACIPRQRHSNRPWYSLVKPARGGEGASGWERSQEEMKWTWLVVCFIFSCKYKLKWREWRSLCLLNYFYCSEKNKEKTETTDGGARCCFSGEKKGATDHLPKRGDKQKNANWINRLEWPSDFVSRQEREKQLRFGVQDSR